jgi:outer membrane protein
MKKTILSLLTFAFLSLSSAAFAQKIGHVDLDSLITLMPEYKTAKEKSEAKLKSLESFLMNLKTEFEQKYQNYMTNSGTMSDLQRKDIEEELTAMQQRIQSRQAEAQTEYQNYNNMMMKPIYEKAKKAIETVAKANNYKYIFDSTIGNILYSEPADDVLPLVKKQLDSMPLAKFPDSGGGATEKPNNAGGGATNPKPNTGGGGQKPKTGGK